VSGGSDRIGADAIEVLETKKLGKNHGG